MDCDGEDDPHDVPRLVRVCVHHDEITAVTSSSPRAPNARRDRCLLFAIIQYRLVHFLLTGRLKFGSGIQRRADFIAAPLGGSFGVVEPLRSGCAQSEITNAIDSIRARHALARPSRMDLSRPWSMVKRHGSFWRSHWGSTDDLGFHRIVVTTGARCCCWHLLYGRSPYPVGLPMRRDCFSSCYF